MTAVSSFMKWAKVNSPWESSTTGATQAAASSPPSSQARAVSAVTAPAAKAADTVRPACTAAWRSSAPEAKARARVAFISSKGCLKLRGRSPITCSTLLGSSEW